MARTVRMAVRSLTFCAVNGRPHISLCTETGEHLQLDLQDRHCCLLNQQLARFVSDLARKPRA